MKLAGNVIDPPTWCGAATTSLCGGRGDPHPLWRSSLVEPEAKVIVIVFTEETWWPSSNTLSECYNNVDVSVPLWLTEPRDKSSCYKSLLSLISLLASAFTYCNICVPLLSRVES